QTELPEGTEATFDIVGNEAYVSIAAFTAQQEAILVRQYRPGPERALVSFPEGYLDPNESPEEAGRRELLEETGYQAKDIRVIRRLNRAYNTETRICLLATGCHWVAEQQLDQSEFIEVFTLPLPDFRAYLRDTQQTDFTTIDIAYLSLDLLGWL
ncbi:MAG: NUDIX hydrolase, partial [Bacteroidota bacterium]